jgi:E3 ubiquitin-protein ligase DOA10
MTFIKFNQLSLIIFPQSFVVVRKIFNTVVERLAKIPVIVASRKLETTSLNRCFTRSIIFKTVSFKSPKKFLTLNSTVLYFAYIEGITAFISNQISARISPKASLIPFLILLLQQHLN